MFLPESEHCLEKRKSFTRHWIDGGWYNTFCVTVTSSTSSAKGYKVPSECLKSKWEYVPSKSLNGCILHSQQFSFMAGSFSYFNFLCKLLLQKLPVHDEQDKRPLLHDNWFSWPELPVCHLQRIYRYVSTLMWNSIDIIGFWAVVELQQICKHVSALFLELLWNCSYVTALFLKSSETVAMLLHWFWNPVKLQLCYCTVFKSIETVALLLYCF